MVLLSLSRGYLHFTARKRFTGRFEQKLAWSSANFAFMTDVVMGLYGGGFKKKEMLSARFGDILSWMYLLSATLRRFEAEGEKENDRVYVEFIGHYALNEIQNAFDAIYANIGSGALNMLFKYTLRPLFRLNPLAALPQDRLYVKLAEKLTNAPESRNLLTEGIYLPEEEKEQLAAIDSCFALVLQAKDVKQKIKKAIHANVLQKTTSLFKDALEAGVITTAEHDLLVEAQKMSEAVVQVDTYKSEDYLARK
jgi:acyl-CoA dehydrogenase